MDPSDRRVRLIAITERGRKFLLRCRRAVWAATDRLLVEVPEEQVEDAAKLVKDEMERAYELEVPLRADVGWGSNWAEAAPAGH